VLGLLIDGEAAKRAHEIGLGFASSFELGGRSNIDGDAPLEGEFTIERLGDGRFTCTGPMFKGFRVTLGSMALLRSRAAPGPALADPAEFKWTRLRRGVRLRPLGPAHQG